MELTTDMYRDDLKLVPDKAKIIALHLLLDQALKNDVQRTDPTAAMIITDFIEANDMIHPSDLLDVILKTNTRYSKSLRGYTPLIVQIITRLAGYEET